MHRRRLALVVLAVLLDALTTSLGLKLGLSEQGPIASSLLPALGPLYWPLQLLALLSLYLLLEALPWTRGLGFTVGLGPWVAGWLNLYRIAGVLAG